MAKRTKRLIEDYQEDESIRLNKYLSDAGACSRREADRYIQAGEVTVDGVTATIGTKVKLGQKVLLHGKPVSKDEQLVLIAFNKPRGIVCTTDPKEKDNVIDFIQYGKRIYPIGRLDKDSEGLLLLTNDGNIVNKILRAGNNHEKEYIVTVNKQITSDFLKGMAAGVPILDTVTRPCRIKALDKFTFQIILTQGLNRQIRRMCEYFDYKVMTLQRIRIMNIKLGHLQLGGYRNVTEKEIEGLKELMSNSINTPYKPEEEWEIPSYKTPGDKAKKIYKGSTTNVERTIRVESNKESGGKKGNYSKAGNKKVKPPYGKKSINSKSANNKSTNNKSTNNKSEGSPKVNLDYSKMEIPPRKNSTSYEKNQINKSRMKNNSQSESKNSFKNDSKINSRSFYNSKKIR